MSAIIETLMQRAELTPDRIAFIGCSHSSDQVMRLSYAQLLEKVKDYASMLESLQPQCIALRAENSLDWVIADLAAIYIKLPIVPIPMFFTAEQIRHTLDSAGVDLLLGDWPDTLSASLAQPLAVTIGSLDVWKICDVQPARLLPHSAKVTFTSGSTGTPKGVCLSSQHLATVSMTLKEAIATQAKCDTHLVLLPLSTLLENITGIYVPIMLGASSVVLRGEDVGLVGSSQFDAQRFAHALASYQPNSLVLTPALLMALIHVAKQDAALVASLVFVAVGGARVAPQLMQYAHAMHIPAFEGYGLSECGSVVSLNTPSQLKIGTCGRVLPHSKVMIAPDGEVLVKDNVALGYINQPFNEQWLATGDLGSLDEQGYLSITGRKKNQIITSFGRNVSPEWVESEAQIFAPLRTMVVVGEGQQHLTAVVDGGDQSLVLSAIEQLNQKLPDYANIGDVLTVSDLRSYHHLFTSNGRPIRQAFESWLSDTNVPSSVQRISIAPMSIYS
ncbi:AMP-binding protein [Vibrio aestuarianus]|uniref:AMP-binding protein n=1 Tax=Vibrio aestuarianus TaxID=28171 RepID=A0A9X4FFV5_9VIBR|nr:AMP-binding protein [Vibrio aestuarianus]MDE1311947.1 AMP-binding protein [Vibrio aestuarianus]MDE1333704.1 AMP-binding protein [Vibrio aestuarianus]MDE1357702.1 AMP-binding protein [Vibrio aestuarianus]NGZ18770.1 long-chain fatty acid--CoA ligase [Vibrio aestuarianus]NGZ92811.1 long-chain fatty acid--CoA ligase [Vibrio aestuarianus subsp. cardii]